MNRLTAADKRCSNEMSNAGRYAQGLYPSRAIDVNRLCLQQCLSCVKNDVDVCGEKVCWEHVMLPKGILIAVIMSIEYFWLPAIIIIIIIIIII